MAAAARVSYGKRAREYSPVWKCIPGNFASGARRKRASPARSIDRAPPFSAAAPDENSAAARSPAIREAVHFANRGRVA